MTRVAGLVLAVLGAWFAAQGTWLAVRGSRYVARGTWLGLLVLGS